MDRRNIPLLLMLIAGGITCIITFVKKCSVFEKLACLLLVFVVFFVLGSILKWTLDRFEKQNLEAIKEEGAVIEKDSESETVETKPEEK